MRLFQAVAPALVITLAIGVSPALAQHSRGSHATSSPSRGAAQAAPRAQAGAAAVPRVAPRTIVPGGVRVAPYYGYYPYYSFRPRLSLGYGLWLGYPVAYPYYYPYPYAYPYPYDPYGYYPYPGPNPNYPDYPYPAPSGSVNVTPTTTSGLSFDITPSNAEVYVDGQRMGTIADFSPTMPPLTLTPGRHSIDIRANGYQSIVFDADIVAGQVLPYQGVMRPE